MIPSDASYAAYCDQAISKSAPHPPAPAGTVTFPTQAQQAAAENIVAQQWSSVIG